MAGSTLRPTHQPAENSQAHLEKTLAHDMRALCHTYPAKQILKCKLGFDVEHRSRQSNAADMRRIVSRYDSLKLHPLTAILGDRDKCGPHALGRLMDNPIFNNNGAPLGNVIIREPKDLVNRPFDFDTGFISHAGHRCVLWESAGDRFENGRSPIDVFAIAPAGACIPSAAGLHV